MLSSLPGMYIYAYVMTCIATAALGIAAWLIVAALRRFTDARPSPRGPLACLGVAVGMAILGILVAPATDLLSSVWWTPPLVGIAAWVVTAIREAHSAP